MSPLTLGNGRPQQGVEIPGIAGSIAQHTAQPADPLFTDDSHTAVPWRGPHPEVGSVAQGCSAVGLGLPLSL